ncbi:DUF6580 family putative transport protein [Mucilaginibacter sp.]
MSKQKINTRNIILLIIIVFITIMRLLTFKYQSWSNFTPVGAIAIFSGVYFNEKWKAYIIILGTFFLSDIIINHYYTGHWSLWSSYTFWNCLCFAIVVLVGSLIKKINVATGLIIALAPVVIHWLVMDLPWVTFYPNTIAGYGQSLIAAIPFEKNMLLGDVVFGIILVGGFELAKSKFAVLRSQKQLAV